MNITFCNSNDKSYQKLLNDLMKETFLDFQFFYDLDLWDANYESYSIIQDQKIVSKCLTGRTASILWPPTNRIPCLLEICPLL